MDEQELEQQLQNKPAPRVTLAEIEALMARVQYLGGRVGETTSTVVHAFLDGEFMLASGHSACVSAANFDAELGFRMAKENAQKKARDALWQFEGYYLRCKLHKENATPPPLGAAHPGYSTMPPHQQRVVDEKTELDDKLAKLRAFFLTPLFGSLDPYEQTRLDAQADAMQGYSSILAERIAAF